eukprot:3941865-Rhodomonas_salina.4
MQKLIDASAERLHEEKDSIRRELQDEKDAIKQNRNKKKEHDNDDDDEDREDAKRVKKLKAKLKAAGEEKTQLEKEVERLERELARRDEMLELLDVSGEEEEDDDDDEETNVRTKERKKQQNNKGEGKRKQRKGGGKGQKSGGGKGGGRCAHVWKVVAEKEEALRYVRSDVNASREHVGREHVCGSRRAGSDSDSGTNNGALVAMLLCAALFYFLLFLWGLSSPGPAMTQPREEGVLFKFLLFLQGALFKFLRFLWCELPDEAMMQPREEGAGPEVVEAARRFVRRRARVLELKAQLGLEENAERERMVALQVKRRPQRAVQCPGLVREVCLPDRVRR